MAKRSDMSSPVTRAELRQELSIERKAYQASLRSEIRSIEERFATKADLQRELERFATKADLERELERFATKADLERYATKADLDLVVGAISSKIDLMGKQLSAEIAQHTRAAQESMQTQIAAVDDKYLDLPSRVTRLENNVLAPKRDRRR
ncbi:MAG: hypothetical protein JWO36_6938 [Myxococcales bacterium]|nr:hypothetical protein [Myxococcales bacterium]